MKYWFTSDTHFGSERTLSLSKRPFKSVEEMDATLINNWNSVVSEDDIVLHLGDFGDIQTASKLNGNIILIMGNYDRKDYDLFRNSDLFLNVYSTDVFSAWITDECLGVPIDYNINLAHEPSKLKDHYNKNTINLFGHIHKLQMVKSYGLNVGTDCHNYTPIDMGTILFYYNAINNHYDNEVFE